MAAHEPGQRGGIEGRDEELLVGLQLALPTQVTSKASDGHVGDGEQLVEDDAEVLMQSRSVVGLQRRLRRRQKSPTRVVDQVEGAHPISAIATGVQRLEARDASGEHAATTLLVDVGRTRATTCTSGREGADVAAGRIRLQRSMTSRPRAWAWATSSETVDAARAHRGVEGDQLRVVLKHASRRRPRHRPSSRCETARIHVAVRTGLVADFTWSHEVAGSAWELMGREGREKDWVMVPRTAPA